MGDVTTSNNKYLSSNKKPGKTKAFFICIVIASFLWLGHSLNTVYTHSFRIPVTFVNVPQNKKPLRELPQILVLDVKASGIKLLLMLFNKPFKTLEIDFNTLKSVNQNQNYVISSSRLDFKKVLKVESTIKHINPDTIYFSEKTGFQKNVPLKVPMYLKCREGFAFKKPVINPTYISIFGDTNLIRTIDTIYTQPLSLNALDRTVNLNLDLIKPNPKVYTSVYDASVYIEVDKLVEHQVRIPIYDIHRAEGYRVNLFPSFANIKFTSIQNSFNVEDTSLFKVLIDSDKINKQSRKCQVFLGSIPGNVTVLNVEPKDVEILILKK